MKRSIVLGVLHIAVIFCNSVFSQDSVYDDLDSLVSPSIVSFEDQLPFNSYPGEGIDPRTGNLSWETTDLVVPGPAGLDIVVSHSFNKARNGGYLLAGSWELEVPRIIITGPPTLISNVPGSYELCSHPRGFGGWKHGATFMFDTIKLVLPGQAPKTLLLKYSSDAENIKVSQFPDVQYVTTDNYVATCLTVDGRRDGFLVTAPDGTEYRMDKLNKQQGDDHYYSSRKDMRYEAPVVMGMACNVLFINSCCNRKFI